ncbi:CBS domain-containing protein [Actinomadura viridis]|uniref:CBS domain-containing protein n=1 Tax=Actinomadura viridis TaxID=58110 RepID=A0A931DTE9_9ACTN|nr:CBS domain-containing protein [Actinomadura viridis]MBG6093586.1 CBS domain-containing protein [Actinomadura viridis]
MRRPTVRQVMTSEVVSVRPGTPFRQVVSTLAEHRISGVPVVDDDGGVVGVVTEADLLRKEEEAAVGAGARRRTILPGLARATRFRGDAGTAGEVMTAPAVTTTPDATIVEAGRTLSEHGFKRLPVVDPEGRLVGVVSRADLLRVFLKPDAQIHEEVIHEIVIQSLWLDPAMVEADVRDGVVTLRGRVSRASLVPLAERLTASIDGVVDVVNRLDYDEDDTVPAHGRHRR